MFYSDINDTSLLKGFLKTYKLYFFNHPAGCNTVFCFLVIALQNIQIYFENNSMTPGP